MNFILQNIWTIAILPLLVFLFIVLGNKLLEHLDRKIAMFLSIGTTVLGLIFSIVAVVYCVFDTTQNFEESVIWLNIGNFNFSFGYIIDELSSMMMLIVTSISLAVQVFSHKYMGNDDSYTRFFAYLAFFNFAMLGLVMSNNLFQFYIFWELVGIASYLLIGFWYKKNTANKAAQKAFLVNKIGDIGLLLGSILFLYFSYNFWSYESEILLGFETLKPAAEVALAASGANIFFIISMAIFLGAIAKSAQFPLHVWLPDAMEAPTPASALIHAATMVTAGVFLVARLYPIFILSPQAMEIISWTGAITALLGASMALVQYDIKKALAYSTCSQLGLIMMALGAGAYSAGLFHLLTHAYFKALLFLGAGCVIYALHHQQDIRYMGGLRQKMPIVAYSYFAGAMALGGLFVSGFSSKEKILSMLFSSNNLLFIIALLVSFLSTIYIFRTYFLIFEGRYRGKSEILSIEKSMSGPLVFLAVPVVLLGILLSSAFDDFINLGYNTHPNSIILGFFTTILSLFALWITSIFYWDKFKKLDPDLLKFPLKPLYKMISEKYYIDNFYEIICKIYQKIAYFCSYFDRLILDKSIESISHLPSLAGSGISRLQNKLLSTYVLISVILLIILSLFVMSIINLIE